MESTNIYDDKIDMRACCSMMRNPTCLLCLQQRYIPNKNDHFFSFKFEPAEEIEE